MSEYAERLSKIPPYLFGEIARLKSKAVAEGKDLIDFGIGDPDQPTPKVIIEKLAEAASRPECHRYDESDYGWPEFIEAAARWFKRRFGVDLDPSNGELLEIIGSKEALAHLVWAYIEDGDISLVPEPGYTVYKVNTAMAGGTPYAMPLMKKNNFLPDLTVIPSDVAKKAKLLFINYPNNPTGAIATKEFFADVVAFAKEHDIVVCHDCAYSEVSFDGYRAPSFLEVSGAKDVAIEMHSLSKSFNMTGWRIGFAAGNPEIVRALNKMKSNIDSKQFPGIASAAAFALDNLEGNSETYAIYEKRRNILVDGFNSLGWNLERNKATLYLWIPVPPKYTSMEFAKLMLEKAGVLVIPGVGYGEHGEGYVRASLTVQGDKNGERVAEAVERMRNNIAIEW